MSMPSKVRLRPLVVVVAWAFLLGFGACGDNEGNGGAPDARTFDARPGVPDGPVNVLDAPLPVVDAGPPDAPHLPDAPEVHAIDASVADALVIGDAGVSQLKVLHFTTDSEGFVQSFADPGTAMTWRSDDGDPPGSLSFTAINAGTVKVLSPQITWETWGVPHGAQVLSVGIKSYKRRLAAFSDMDHSWAFQVVGADNQPAHDGVNGAYLELTSLTHILQPDWETVTNLPHFDVKPAYRASNTPLFVKVWYFPLLTGAIDWRVDEIELEVVYFQP